MTKQTLKDLIDSSIDDVCAEYLKSIDAPSGDITPDQWLILDELEDAIADLIIAIGKQNKGE